ncbi:hypothetical protein QTP88_024059 [Uroleucon formosanum]
MLLLLLIMVGNLASVSVVEEPLRGCHYLTCLRKNVGDRSRKDSLRLGHSVPVLHKANHPDNTAHGGAAIFVKYSILHQSLPSVRWHDGFSVFYLGSDGLVHKLTADKMKPDNDPVIEDKNPLAVFLGLSLQLGNLDCLISFDSEPANELLKMFIMSLDDVLAPSGINKCVALTPTTSSLLSAAPSVDVPQADAWEDRNRLEDAVLKLDLRYFHPQTIVIEDTPIFLGLIRDIFTALDVSQKLDLEFEKQVRQVTIYLKLQPEDNLGLKVVKLFELLEVRHSVFIIGVTGTGKYEICKTLYRTCANLKFKPYINDIEPKAVTNDELLGDISLPSREWVDGLISYLIRDESQMSGDGFKLMLNDGDIDPINIRSSRSVFNYFIDPGSKQLLPWSDLDLVSSFELNPDIPLQQKLTFINTIETTRTRSFLDLLVGKKKEIMLVGATDIGKSVIIDDKFKPLSNDLYAVANELVNFYTASELLRKISKKPLEKKARRNFGPPGGKTLINLIDDINMPESHALNKQFMEYYHWYDKTKSYLKDVQNVIFTSGMSPAAESFNLDSQLQSNLYVLALSDKSIEQKHQETFSKTTTEKLNKVVSKFPVDAWRFHPTMLLDQLNPGMEPQYTILSMLPSIIHVRLVISKYIFSSGHFAVTVIPPLNHRHRFAARSNFQPTFQKWVGNLVRWRNGGGGSVVAKRLDNLRGDTPIGLLRGIKHGTESYHVLYAGLHCVVIKGYSNRFRNSWNAVYVVGAWRFVQCNWGARHLVNAKEIPKVGAKGKSDSLSVFFEWQLLKNPITQHVRLTCYYYYCTKLLLLLLYNINTNKYTNTNLYYFNIFHLKVYRAATVRIAIPTNMQSSLIFHYNLKFYESEEDTYDGVSLKRFVMQSVLGNIVSFRVHAPNSGAFLLDIFANSVTPKEYLTGEPMKFKSVCKFKIICEELQTVMATRLFGLIPISHQDPLVFAGRELEIQFRMSKPLTDFMATLHKNGVEEKRLSKYISHTIVDDFITFLIGFPEEGQYGLDVYTHEISSHKSDENGHHNHHQHQHRSPTATASTAKNTCSPTVANT